MLKRVIFTIFVIAALVVSTTPAAAGSAKTMIGINVVLKSDISDAILADLGTHGTVRDVVYEIKAVTLQARAGELAAIQALPYVAAANPDAERNTGPVDPLPVSDFSDGLSTWDLDAINVTDYGFDNRQVEYDGTGVYVAVLDTGLVDGWQNYFPVERIAVQFGKAFNGGGGNNPNVSEPTNKWEHDQSSHGTHVTSTILGYRFGVNKINGVAPMVTILPVKVLNQNGSGWSSVIARGIVYVTDLKVNGDLGTNPVVINMSLGGGVLDAMEKAAIDYAVANGVIIVASAGNNGTRGMGYPGAYAPVISVAATGWTGQWLPNASRSWWYQDVADPTTPADFYIAAFSSRAKTGQDLDVAAPGSWVLGPYQVNGQVSYYYLSGTSMASPHVAGIVALMAEKDPSLTAADAEAILTGAAIPFPAGSRSISDPYGVSSTVSWGADATGSGLITADAALNAIP